MMVDVWFTEIWSRPSWSIAGSHLTWSQPHWLMAGSLKFDLDRLARCVVHWKLISAVLVDCWFTLNLISITLVDGWVTKIWSRQSWSMSIIILARTPEIWVHTLLAPNHIGWLLIHCNFISTELVDERFTEIWSRPSWSMSGSLKLDFGCLGRYLAHSNLISAVVVNCWFTLNLLPTTLVDGWFTEIWSRPP